MIICVKLYWSWHDFLFVGRCILTTTLKFLKYWHTDTNFMTILSMAYSVSENYRCIFQSNWILQIVFDGIITSLAYFCGIYSEIFIIQKIIVCVCLQPTAQHYHYVANVRENSVPTMSSQTMSPYNVLPPVGSARKVSMLLFCTNSTEKKLVIGVSGGVQKTIFESVDCPRSIRSFVRSFVRSFILCGQGSSLLWDLLNRSSAPAQGEEGSW